MSASEIHTPALSTPQDESVFTYAKVNKAEIKRTHLNLAQGDDYTAKLHEYYSLSELAQFLSREESNEKGVLTRKYKTVTLQFPDSLICDSATIVQELQKMLKLSTRDILNQQQSVFTENPNSECKRGHGCSANGCSQNTCTTNPQDSMQRLWILADTSYSACCIDEVAAQHVNADLVVHFGDACLNPVATLSSAYVFGKPHLDLDTLAMEFRARYPIDSFKGEKIVLMADAPHTSLLRALAERLSGYQIILTDLLLADANSQIIGYEPLVCADSDLKVLGRVFQNVTVEDNDDSVLSECALFHIGLPEAPRLLQLTTNFQSVTTFYDGHVSQGPFPNLMRRYRYMHMARAAGTVGILINTLSLANTKLLVNQLSKKIKDAGKKHYIFVVGKPNVAKLANFEAVDMWCVLGCDHQGIILDHTSEYFKPIITPYELIMAIGDDFTWTGKWVTDFRNVLHEMGDEDDAKDNEPEKAYEDQESDEEPQFNPVTGQYTSTSRPLRRIQHLRVTMNEEPANDGADKNESIALVKKLSGAVELRNTVSTSAAHLQTRHWTGLGSDWTNEADEEGATVQEGTSGIARSYEFDIEHKLL